ncbi:MAG: hypothetical protein WAL98_16380 [Desulfatiglandaceae bacterium]|jgi:hypothetical protein
MPLAFESLSHGRIAFGFFNIESDMLLLEKYFFFADNFCKSVEKIINSSKDGSESRCQVWYIAKREDIGDFMGAMDGIRFIGFMGELYRKFPFPVLPGDFKQKPEGWRTQPEIEKIIEKYGKIKQIPFRVDRAGEYIQIGEYFFSTNVFKELIQYVWEGGYPKWRNGERPEYVIHMKDWIGENEIPLLKGLYLV